MTTTLRELFVNAWHEGFGVFDSGIASDEEKFSLFRESEVADNMGSIPEMYLLDEGVWVWIVRSIAIKEKKLIPLDKLHYVFAVEHDWVENENDMKALKEQISKAFMQMSGFKPEDISPRNPEFN